MGSATPRRSNRPGPAARYLLLPVALLLLFLGPVDRTLRAMEIVALNASGGHLAMVTRLAPDPVPDTVSIDFAGSSIDSDFYDPGGFGKQPRIVLVNGLVEDGRNYPLLVLVARSLTRTGFQVLVPELYNYQHLRLDARDSAVLAATLRHGDRANAILGFSVGGSLAMIAANQVAHPVGVITIGAYGSLPRVIETALTGQFEHDGHTIPYQPASVVWAAVRDTLLAELPPTDAALLRDIFPGRSPQPVDSHAQLAPALSGEGRTVYELILARERDHVMQRMVNLPNRLRRLIDELSPANQMGPGRGQTVLYHFTGDPFIPSQEGIDLARQLAPRSQLFDSGLIDHGEIALPPLNFDSLRSFYLPETAAFIGFSSAALSAAGR